MEQVTPNEIARSLGVTGLQFRNWLRAQKDAVHPIVAGHEWISTNCRSPSMPTRTLGTLRQ
jgi:hypothetical protein